MTKLVFELHDGEDEAKTNALVEFLGPLKDAGGEWEGDNSGITVWMPPVGVGDLIITDHDGRGIRIHKKGEPFIATRGLYCFVHRAMEEIEYDNGGHHVNRILGPGTVNMDAFEVPFDYGIERLLIADMALQWVSAQRRPSPNPDDYDSSFELFVVGDVDSQEAFIKEHSEEQPGLQIAHDLLNDWFNGWERPYKWEQAK